MSPPVRVAIADDHPVIRAGLRHILAADPALEVVGEAADGVAALALARAERPDVLLLDVEMPGMTGVEVAQALRAEGSAVRVLALSAHADRAYVEGLLRAGAAGYVTKGRDPAQIAEAVRAVARGEGRWFVTPATPASDPLSEREREVLTLLAGGRSNAEIAEAMALSPHTVRNHLASAYSKLGVATAREAVAWAWEHGLGGGPAAR